jgi:hypothetical protein
MADLPKTRKIYMSFFCRGEWVCGFLEIDLKTPVCRRRTFASVNKIRELIDRTPTKMNLEDRSMLEHDIEKGRGGLYLDVTEEQYEKLKH